MKNRIAGPISLTQACVALLLSIGLSAGCTDEAPPSVTEASAGPPPDSSPAATATRDRGAITVSINGDEKIFDDILADNTYYTQLASQVTAGTAGEATARLQMTFSMLNLRDFDYPVNLPPPKDFTNPMDPMTAGAVVGFSYIDPDGTEWAGPGNVRVESYGSDGVLSGSFSDVTLPHTDKQLPNVLLTDGTFRVRISDQW